MTEEVKLAKKIMRLALEQTMFIKPFRSEQRDKLLLFGGVFDD